MISFNELPNCEPDERIVLFLRRHWIEVLRMVITTGILVIIPFFVSLMLTWAEAPFIMSSLWTPLATSVTAGYLLLVFALTMNEVTDYWLDTWIVTSERIINSEQKGLFNRIVSEVKLEQIQDITSEVKGILPTVLTYGNVFIQTAAERERFQFKNIDNPDDVKIAIAGLATTCKTQHHHPHAAEWTPPVLKDDIVTKR